MNLLRINALALAVEEMLMNSPYPEERMSDCISWLDTTLYVQWGPTPIKS